MENLDRDIVVSQNGNIEAIPVSMQVYQAIYNEITGKTEAITDSYKNFLIIESEDLLKLRHVLKQFLEQYHVSAFNESITIFHTKASKEGFSSFERLRTYNVNNNSPIERINIEINILITPPKISKPQNYTITINLISGAAVMSKNKSSIPDEIPGMFIVRAVQDKAAEIRIEYVDYIIARGLSDLLREWIGSIKEQQPNNKLKSIQKKSHYFTTAFKFAFFILALVVSVYYAIKIIPSDMAQSQLVVKFLLISGSSIILAKEIGLLLGRNIERKVDSINTNELSYININAGDKKLYAEFQQNIKSEKWEAWKSGLLALGIGVISSIIATLIYNSYLL